MYLTAMFDFNIFTLIKKYKMDEKAFPDVYFPR